MLIWLRKFIVSQPLSFCEFRLLILSFIILTSSLRAQEQTSESVRFINASGGFGNIYGGFGANLEAGSGHLAAFGTAGYATARVIDTLLLNATTNFQIGLRYYFNVGSEVLFPRIGIGYGWVTNYYNAKIGNSSYDQTVHGINAHVGTQVYSPEGFIFSLDLNFASKYAISMGNNHPHFFTLYVRPNIGIGYDLTRLFGRSKRKTLIKNKAINPFE